MGTYRATSQQSEQRTKQGSICLQVTSQPYIMQQNVPNQAIHVVEAPNEKANLKDGCYTKAATVLGVLHIICGVISLGAESAFLDSDFSIRFRIGTGIWTAVFFFISGALSIGG